MTTPTYSPGLEGVIAGETAICTVEGGLSYRGYQVGDRQHRVVLKAAVERNHLRWTCRGRMRQSRKSSHCGRQRDRQRKPDTNPQSAGRSRFGSLHVGAHDASVLLPAERHARWTMQGAGDPVGAHRDFMAVHYRLHVRHKTISTPVPRLGHEDW